MLRMLGLLLIVIAIVWSYRRFVPVRNLREVNYSELSQLDLSAGDVQLLDVRDYLEYENGHHARAINLSIGRLSSFWSRHLVAERPLVLIGARKSEVYMASRFLRKKGFQSIAFALYGVEKQPVNCCTRSCVC